MLYYALTILTTPLVCWVFNAYKKREALRKVRNLRCGGKLKGATAGLTRNLRGKEE